MPTTPWQVADFPETSPWHVSRGICGRTTWRNSNCLSSQLYRIVILFNGDSKSSLCGHPIGTRARVNKLSIFSDVKVKGQGHRTSKTTENWRHVYLRAGDQTTAAHAGADCKFGLTVVRPNLLSTPETLGNWMDGRVSYRHSARHLFLFHLALLKPNKGWRSLWQVIALP